jgi:hypothetical protein
LTTKIFFAVASYNRKKSEIMSSLFVPVQGVVTELYLISSKSKQHFHIPLKGGRE